MNKRIFILSFALFLIAGIAVGKKKADGTAKIRFAETVWDFGTIKADKPVSHDFVFYNDGDGNLIISDYRVECGCTRPEIPEKPTAPGKSGKVKVTYNPIGRPGSFEKTVTLITNGKPQKARIKIRGNVVPK